MDYPKSVMKKSELIDMGFPRDFLHKAHMRGGIAWKVHPEKANSVILFDTQALEKYRQEQMRIDHTINTRR